MITLSVIILSSFHCFIVQSNFYLYLRWLPTHTGVNVPVYYYSATTKDYKNITFSVVVPYRYTSGMKMASCGVVAELSIWGYSLSIRSFPASFALVVFMPKPRLNSMFWKKIMKNALNQIVKCYFHNLVNL